MDSSKDPSVPSSKGRLSPSRSSAHHCDMEDIQEKVDSNYKKSRLDSEWLSKYMIQFNHVVGGGSFGSVFRCQEEVRFSPNIGTRVRVLVWAGTRGGLAWDWKGGRTPVEG